jgi:hypothetical protein
LSTAIFPGSVVSTWKKTATLDWEKRNIISNFDLNHVIVIAPGLKKQQADTPGDDIISTDP